MSYKEHEAKHLRLTILRTLLADSDYQINDSLLRDAIKVYGFSPSREALRNQLNWLDEMDLITVEDLGGVRIAKLTERGADAAVGAVTIDGVKRPGP